MSAIIVEEAVARLAVIEDYDPGDGPCFDTPERAMAFRDGEDERLRLWCEARANRFACWDDGRALKWREVWDRQGWPDHRGEQ